jgi:SAM-dependent methyltransferase
VSAEWDRQVRGAEAFAGAYERQPPWDIGRPQAALRDAADRGLLAGHVLDAGCGTGEHALLAAGLGLGATGVDVVPEAIRRARAKARDRGLDVRFEVADVLGLRALGETYDTVVDCGLFHALDPSDAAGYVTELGHVVRPGGLVLLLCFSDQVPGDAGPRRVRRSEIRDAFASGWAVESVEDAAIEVAFGPVDAVHAWLATIRRDADPGDAAAPVRRP